MALFGEVISTGSEMMLGKLIDTNSAYLSGVLTAHGISVARHTAVGDDLGRLEQAFRRGWEENDVIVATGGLGPTEDDLTRQAVSRCFGAPLEYHQDLADALSARLAAKGYPVTENNLRQAWLPKGSLLVPNPVGTAPGFAWADGRRLMAFLPGVPKEMKAMVAQWLLPRLSEQYPDQLGRIKTVVLKTTGLGESMVDSLISDLMGGDRNPAVGLLAAPHLVRVVVAARGAGEAEIDALLAPVLADLGRRLAGHVIGYDTEAILNAPEKR